MIEGKSTSELLNELETLKDRVRVAEETLEAIRTGEVDAVAVKGVNGTRIFTLEGADETYRVLVERMSESAVTLSNEGIILYSNSQFAQLVNLPLKRVIGSPFKNYLPIEFIGKFERLFHRGWKEVVKGEFVIKPFNKEILHIHLSLNSIATKDMVVLGMMITDLSERKELEKLSEAKLNLGLLNVELTDKNKQLTKTNFDLDSFIYTASHDLKAPISNIEGLIITLKSLMEEEGMLKGDMESVIDMMSHSVIRFKQTILDLTEISKIQKNFEEDISLLNFKEIIEDVRDSIRSIIDSKSVKINVNTNDCPEIVFSKKNLKSVIYNLMSNAIKYSDPKRNPEISIVTKKENNSIILSVEDNGLGIPSKDKAKIFSMFKRLHDHVEGTGIGLYIVKRIMDNTGGKIEVESEIGSGTKFNIFFNNTLITEK